MDTFHKKVKYWFEKSKLALNNRKDKKEELSKRLFLVEQAEPNPDFSTNMINACGLYNVVGGNPDSEESYYRGLLHIELIENQLEANWLIEGEQVQNGYGFVFNNILVLNFSYQSNSALFSGVVAYEFVTSDIMIGKWAEEVAIENAFEMGRKLSPDELGEPYPEDFLSAN